MVILPPIQPVAAQGTKPERNGQTMLDEAASTFSRLFDDVNNLQLAADRKIDEFATSKDKDVHGTMIALQEADLSLRLFLQVRAKLTSAFQEIMRMQV
jgi:flagellar hook-basal body complex protein FliE